MEPDRFRILGLIEEISVIASGRGVRVRHYLTQRYGGRNWRKLKGVAFIEEDNGWTGKAEIHWYEAHGVGKVDWKVKTRIVGR